MAGLIEGDRRCQKLQLANKETGSKKLPERSLLVQLKELNKAVRFLPLESWKKYVSDLSFPWLVRRTINQPRPY